MSFLGIVTSQNFNRTAGRTVLLAPGQLSVFNFPQNLATNDYLIHMPANPTIGEILLAVYVFSEVTGEWTQSHVIPTPLGIPGAPGASGTDGNDGVTGAPGASGTDGNDGATGATGAPGATGASGTDGNDGATGAPGATGASGTDGNDGATGAPGASGTDGNDGATGAPGATGASGTDGNDGATGASGATGPNGPISALSDVNITAPTNNQVLTYVSNVSEWQPKDVSTTHSHSLNALTNVEILENDTTSYSTLSSTSNLLYRYKAQDATEDAGVVDSWPADTAVSGTTSGILFNDNSHTLVSSLHSLPAVRTPLANTALRLGCDLEGSLRSKTLYLALSNITSLGLYREIGKFSSNLILWHTNSSQWNLFNEGSTVSLIPSVSQTDIYILCIVVNSDGTVDAALHPTQPTLVSVGTAVKVNNNAVSWFELDHANSIQYDLYEYMIFDGLHSQGQIDDIMTSLTSRYNPIALSLQANAVLKANSSGTNWINGYVDMSEITGVLKSASGATMAPTSNDDVTQGYEVGSRWLDVTNIHEYVCFSGVTGNAVWKGTDGATGATGASGNDGATGASGNDGAAGATGAPGATGATGASGTDGNDGATGALGATGPTGPTGYVSEDRPWDPVPIQQGNLNVTGNSYTYYTNVKSSITKTLTTFDFHLLGGSDDYRAGLYTGRGITAALKAQTAQLPGLNAGAHSAALVAESGENLTITANADYVIAFTVNGTSGRTLGITGVEDVTLAWFNSTDSYAGFTVSPLAATATSVRICCHLN